MWDEFADRLREGGRRRLEGIATAQIELCRRMLRLLIVANRPRFGYYSPVSVAQLYRVGWFSYPRDSSARQDQLNGWQVARRWQQGLLVSISICSLRR